MVNKQRGKSRSKKRTRRGHQKHGKELESLRNVPLPKDPIGSDMDEDQLSEQDFEFVSENSHKLSFLEKIEKDEMDQQVINKQKAEMEKRQKKIKKSIEKKIVDEKESFEKGEDASDTEDRLDREHTKLRNLSKPNVKEELDRHSLPLKTPDGRIVFEQEMDSSSAADQARRVSGITVDDAFIEDEEAESNHETQSNPEVKNEATNDVVESDNSREIQDSYAPPLRTHELRTEIAVLGNAMLTNAEKSVASLKKLLVLCKNEDSQIQKLAMVSCTRVFKDIVPGYKIQTKAVFDDDLVKKKIDKETLKTKEYESLLLRCYQAFLKILLNAARAAKQRRDQSALRVCIKCLCGLAESLHHFNYGTDIIKSVVGWMKEQDEIILDACKHCLSQVVRSDSDGYRTLEIVQFLGDLIKREKCQCSPKAVEPLLEVRFEDIATLSKEDKREKKPSKNRRRKMFKIRDKMEKRGEEFDVHKPVKDKAMEAKARLQSQTVESLFEVFFRVLKHCSHQAHSRSCYEHESSVRNYITQKCPLVSICLKGLAKFAHIMSVEYFEDLLQVMTKMLNCASLPSYERFQCLFTISSIFRGQGDALTIDRKEFYQHLYGALENWKPDTVKEKETNKADVRGSSFKDGSRHLGISLVHVCHQMLCETKTSDFGRLASFTKRMLSIGMHQETGLMMGLLSLTNKLIVKYRRLRILMEGESETPIHGTVYDPSNDDPSLAGGLLTSLWEITQLRKHYHPHVSQAANHFLRLKPDATGTSAGLMAAVLCSADGPPGIASQYNTLEGTFCPLPSTAHGQISRKKRKRSSDSVTVSFRPYLDQA